MFNLKKVKELHGLVDARTKALTRAESKLQQRNAMINVQLKQIEELKERNRVLEDNLELVMADKENTEKKATKRKKTTKKELAETGISTSQQMKTNKNK